MTGSLRLKVVVAKIVAGSPASSIVAGLAAVAVARVAIHLWASRSKDSDETIPEYCVMKRELMGFSCI